MFDSRHRIAWPKVGTWIAATIFLVVLAVRLKYPVFSTPHIDLAVYLKGAHRALNGSDALYAPMQGLPFTYPPFAALLLTAFAPLPERFATFALTLLSLLALLSVTHRWLRWQRPSAQPVPIVIVATLAGFAMLLQPVARTLELGQVNLLLLWAIVFDVTMKPSRWRGVFVGIAAGFKLTPGVFIVWFALTRQWRACITSVVSFFSTIVVGFVFLPHSAWKYWTETFFDAERVGGLAYSGNQSLNGVIWRALGEGGSRALWFALVVVVSAFAVWLIVTQYRVGAMHLSLLSAALWGLLISPVSWDHHWVWLWIVMLVLGEYVFLKNAPSTYALDITRVLSALLLALLAIATLANVIWLMPNENDREYHVSVMGKLLTDAYPILGLCVVGLLAWCAKVSNARSSARGLPLNNSG